MQFGHPPFPGVCVFYPLFYVDRFGQKFDHIFVFARAPFFSAFASFFSPQPFSRAQRSSQGYCYPKKRRKTGKTKKTGGKRTRTIEPCFSLFRARRLVSPRTQGKGERGRTIVITPRVFARRDDVCGEGSGTWVPSKTKENSRRA